MLITRKLTKDKRPVVDFKLLNTRILRRNTSIPLMSDVLSILGNSECEVVSCADIKDAYHSIRLTEKSKEYCGILPYFGSPIYRYEVLPMGIACAPQIWMDYITLILSELEDKKKYIAIMDNLLIHSTRVDHWKLLEQLLKSVCKNGLRLSPKKCQLFKTNLIYMGNEFTITKRTMTITPLRSRTEAINKIPTPRTSILSDYLSRHRQKDLDPIPISFFCLKTYRSIIDDRIGGEIFCIKTRASTKASGETVGEVHGADKPLDPNYKPEHQSKSKLPSVTGKSLPEKIIRKPILQTPSRHTPRRLATPKSVGIQSEVVSDMTTPDSSIPNNSDPTPMRTPAIVHGRARPKTPMIRSTPLAPFIRPFPHLQTPPLIPRRILSSTPSGTNGENVDNNNKIIKEVEERIPVIEKKMQELEEQNRKIFHPHPIEGIDTGGTKGLETLDPEIRIPIEEDFVLPPLLESLLDKAKTAYKFLSKQGDIDRLIVKINKKVLRDTNLCVDLRDLKAAYLTSPHFRDIYLYLLQNRMPLEKGAAKRLDQNARNYLILDGLLFKILDDGEGNLDTVLCIPTSKYIYC